MPNFENLIPLNKRSKEIAKEIQKKGGIARGKQETQQKSLKEYINLLWSNKVSLDDKIFQLFPNLKHKEITRAIIPILKQQQKAENGDLKALEFLRDTSGQKPSEKFENKNITEIKFNKNDIKKTADELRNEL
jgi:hypothetical protein